VSGIRAAGIAAELASAKVLLECEGVALRHDWDERGLAGDALPAPVEDVLALVLREAATNIHRHAHARRAEAALRPRDDGVVLRIRDDGRGGAMAPGNGLAGMRERVEALGGVLTVESVRGRGTVLEAWLPLHGHEVAASSDADPSRPDATGAGVQA